MIRFCFVWFLMFSILDAFWFGVSNYERERVGATGAFLYNVLFLAYYTLKLYG